MRRRKVTEPIERFEHKDDAELGQLRSRLARWAADNQKVLRDAKTLMPDTFDNRRADNWRVMLAIADLAGEDWGEKARFVAIKLEGASDISSISVRLLADIKRIVDEGGCDCILSAVLVERLKEDPEQPWAEWGRGKGLTQNSLAVLLGGGGGRGRQAASRTLPTHFRDLFARPFQAASKTLPTPFQDLFAPPLYPPGPEPGRKPGNLKTFPRYRRIERTPAARARSAS